MRSFWFVRVCKIIACVEVQTSFTGLKSILANATCNGMSEAGFIRQRFCDAHKCDVKIYGQFVCSLEACQHKVKLSSTLRQETGMSISSLYVHMLVSYSSFHYLPVQRSIFSVMLLLRLNYSQMPYRRFGLSLVAA